jgi:hypothetical protein
MAGLFNWTMTYRLDSDVVTSYGDFIRRDFNNVSNNVATSSNKMKFAAAIILNCGADSNRLELIKKLQNLTMPIDVYGKCGTFSLCKSMTQSSCYDKLSNEYRFLLSFENSLCKDYVTEKMFLALKYPWIPVVFGAANYSVQAPPKSVIRVQDYKSLDKLVEFLNILNLNNENYQNYFDWKNNFEIVFPYANTWGCQFCQKLTRFKKNKVSGSKRNTYSDIHNWWILQSACHQHQF